jgi:acyl-coenzyme A thioesterase PaaI-like protein
MPRRPLRYGLAPPEELFALAESIRLAMEKMVVIDEPHDELRRARAEIDAIAQRLDAIGRKGLQARMMPEMEPGPDDMRPYYAGDANRWHYNPIFPTVELAMSEGMLRGGVTLGLAYEGPPGCVHGGVVSLLLDQLLGQSNLEHGVAAMTGTLTVTYRRPTPLLRELSLEASPPELIDGRKYVTRGWIRCGGKVTAEGEGVFVQPDFESHPGFPHLQAEQARQLRKKDDDIE